MKKFIILFLLMCSPALASNNVMDKTTITPVPAQDYLYIIDNGTADGKATISSVLTQSESTIEGLLDLQDLQGAVTDAQVPNDITVNSATTASTASALSANGANCSAGQSPLGVDASGAVESCFDVWTEAENTSAGYISSVASDSDWTEHGSYPSACSAGEYVSGIGDTLTCGTPATGTECSAASCDLDTSTTLNEQGICLEDGTNCPAGSTGDVQSVGDCPSGSCYDGSSDGGTYIRLHETATGFYGQIGVSGLTGNTTYTLPVQNGTLLSSGYLANSATLRGLLSDESGTGVAIFAGGNIGAATATTPAENDNDTSVATTAYVQTELAGVTAGDVNWDEIPWGTPTESDLTGVNWADYAKLEEVPAAGSTTISFDNDDLTAGVLSIEHNFNHMYCMVQIYDNSEKLIVPDEVTLVDADNLTVDISSYGTITGTWHAVLSY